MSSICDSCHSGCCRTYRLIITIFDFVDLVHSQGIKKAVEGTTFEPVPFDLNYMVNKQMMYPFIFDNPEKKGSMYSLALKRVESKLFPKTLKCNFLEEHERPVLQINTDLPNHKFHPGSRVEGRCSVYEDRPTMCRTYPLGFNPITKTSILKKRDNLPIAEQNEAYQICPKPELTLADFELEDPKSKMKKNNDLLLSEARTQAHNDIVLKWNSQPSRLLEQVVPFIMAVTNSSIMAYNPQQRQSVPPIVQANMPRNAAQSLEKQKEVESKPSK